MLLCYVGVYLCLAATLTWNVSLAILGHSPPPSPGQLWGGGDALIPSLTQAALILFILIYTAFCHADSVV